MCIWSLERLSQKKTNINCAQEKRNPRRYPRIIAVIAIVAVTAIEADSAIVAVTVAV